MINANHSRARTGWPLFTMASLKAFTRSTRRPALLIPIDWPEPFGLVLIEAMACGTPVIAWRCGSVSEIIENGKTGFIVDTEDEAVRAVLKLDQLDRRIVRKVFQERFTADVMAR